MTIIDIYRTLFGRSSMTNGSVIDMAEHGRAGGVSTGTPFKMIRDVEEKTIIDEADANTTYIGRSKMGASAGDSVWQIKKLTVSGNVTTTTYAGGTDAYTSEWDERANLSYS